MATLDVSIESMTPSFQNSSFYLGSRRMFLFGYGSRLDFDITNNDAGTIGLTASVWKNSGTPVLQVSVDGGAYSDLTMPSATTWTDVALPGADALAAGIHQISLRHKPGSTVNVVAVEYDRAVTATYTTNAPTISLPAGFGTIYSLRQPPFADCSAMEGEWTRNTSLSALPGGGIFALANADGAIRFRANITELRAGIYTNSASSWRLIVDGDVTTSPAKVTPTSNSAVEWITIATGLSGTHDYELVPVVPGNGVFIMDLMLVGGTGLDTTYDPPKSRGRLFGLGDSITLGTTGPADSARSWLSRIGHYTNRAIFNRGVSSNPLVSTISTPGIQDRWHQCTMFGNWSDDVLIIQAGTNDANVTTPDQTAIQKSMEFLLRHVTGAQGWPGPFGKVVVVGLIPYASGNLGTNYAATNTSLSNAVTAVGHASVVFTNPATWSSPAFNVGTMLADTVHPNATGCDCFYTNIRDLVPAWSEPTSGVVGVIGE